MLVFVTAIDRGIIFLGSLSVIQQHDRSVSDNVHISHDESSLIGIGGMIGANGHCTAQRLHTPGNSSK